MLLSKGTETCMNFRYEWRNILKSLGRVAALRPMSSHHARLQPTCLFFISAASDKDWLNLYRERAREEEVEEPREEEEGDEGKDTGSRRRRNRAKVITERSEAGV